MVAGSSVRTGQAYSGTASGTMSQLVVIRDLQRRVLQYYGNYCLLLNSNYRFYKSRCFKERSCIMLIQQDYFSVLSVMLPSHAKCRAAAISYSEYILASVHCMSG